HTDVIFFSNRQKSRKGTTIRTSHIFRTEDRFFVTLQPLDPFLEFLRTVVIMNVMISDSLTCNFSIGFIFSSEDQSPIHTPEVIGCDGFADLAQAKDFSSKGSTRSTLSGVSTFSYEGPVILSGSFQISHPKTRESFANRLMTPFT